MLLDQLLKKMVEKGASDLFLRTKAFPRIRRDGSIEILIEEEVEPDEMLGITNLLLGTQERTEIFNRKNDIDFIYANPEVGRFRVNIFKQRGTPAIVIRHVPRDVKTFEELNLPGDVCKQLCDNAQGLVLVCGPAGNGKSTAIASMIEYINTTSNKHVVTMEDPIEYLFTDKKSIVNQRELDLDVASYPQALKHVTQQSPDVIYIGNIRDVDTMHAAITATELGAFVISTLHTINAVQTVERIVNFFPPHFHHEIRMHLATILKGIIAVRLVPRKDGQGRVPAIESVVVTSTIAGLIQEGRVKEIQKFIDEGGVFGMQSFNQSYVKLVKEKLITEEEALKLSNNKSDLKLALNGIQLGDN